MKINIIKDFGGHMDLSRIPAPLIAETLESVGDSIENERVNERTGERGGHKYVVIDEYDNSICANFIDDESFFPGNQGVAHFKTISKLVETALESKDIKRDQKVKMLEGYQKITQRYEHKQQGWFTRMFAYFFGQGKEVIKAEALIEEGLKKYRPADGEGKFECDGCKYEGEFRNGFLANGAFTDAEGVVYRGHFNQKEKNHSMLELLDGEGSITYPSGISYVGTFVDGKLEGPGKVFSGDFQSFSGEFKEGEMIGAGKAFYPDGRLIESDFFIYGLTGDVKITDPSENKIFVGYMRNGILSGRVEVTDLKENKVYVGQLNNGVMEGSGRVILPDGKYFYGTFVDGKLNGKGMMSDREGVVLYTGELRDNEIRGRGVLYFPDEKKRFEGTFKDSLNGKGKMIDSEGNTVAGELKNGTFKEYEKMPNGVDSTGVAELWDDEEELNANELKAKDKVYEGESYYQVPSERTEIPSPPNYSPAPPPSSTDSLLPPDYPTFPPPPIPQ